MRHLYYFFIIPFILQNLVQDTLGQSVNELAENFYNSSKFLESYFGINEKNKPKIINQLKIQYDNTYFRRVLEPEMDFHRSGVNFQNFEENEQSLNNFIIYFHYITDYVFYNYSELNQFRIKKIKNQHKELLESPLSAANYYARVAFNPSSEIPYNFETGIFEIDLLPIAKNIARYYIPNLITKNRVPRGYSELHISTILFPEMPKMLRLVVKDLDQAEKFSNEDVEIRVNFELINEINLDYNTIDVATQIFDLFLARLQADLASVGKSTDLSHYSQGHLIEKFYEAGGGVMRGYDAYSRKRYFGISARIKSLELKSKSIGTHMWKPYNWFEHVDKE